EHIEDFHRTVLMLGALALYAEMPGADDGFIDIGRSGSSPTGFWLESILDHGKWHLLSKG
ncbi:hypothetical protein ACWCO9_27730, partial [Streptomyces sp. NPDC001937]